MNLPNICDVSDIFPQVFNFRMETGNQPSPSRTPGGAIFFSVENPWRFGPRGLGEVRRKVSMGGTVWVEKNLVTG